MENRLCVNFLEERCKHLQNAELRRKTSARLIKIMQELENLYNEISTAQIETAALRKAIDRHLDAVDNPMIGNHTPAKQEIYIGIEQSDNGSDIPAHELHQFLLALSDLEEKYGFISELEYALQMRELELYKKWAIDKKMWHPPGAS